MSNPNREYYLARAADARSQAADASTHEIAEIHLELASRYELLAQAAEPAPRLRVVNG